MKCSMLAPAVAMCLVAGMAEGVPPRHGDGNAERSARAAFDHDVDSLVTREDLAKEMERLLRPYTAPDGADMEALLDRAREVLKAIDPGALPDGMPRANVSAFLAGSGDEANTAAVRAMLDASEEQGLFTLAAAIRPPFALEEVKALSLLEPGEHGPDLQRPRTLRELAKLTIARGRVAREEGDRERFVEGIGQTLELAHASAFGTTILGHLTGAAIETLAVDEVQRAIADGALDERSLALLGAMLGKPKAVPLTLGFATEKLTTLSTLLDMLDLAEPEQVEVAERPGDVVLAPGMLPFDQQVALTREAFAMWTLLAEIPPHDRAKFKTAQAELWNRVLGDVLLGSLLGAHDQAIRADDLSWARRQGTLVLVALERYRLAHGAYPESLDALAPAFLARPPVDPYSDGSMGYLPPSGGPYEGGRSFVLYAAGSDLKDNGGAIDFTKRYNPDPLKSNGQDMLLNEIAPAQ